MLFLLCGRVEHVGEHEALSGDGRHVARGGGLLLVLSKPNPIDFIATMNY